MTGPKYGVTQSGDPTTTWGKNFVFRTQPNPFHPEDNPSTFQTYLDERAIPGGCYFSGGMVKHVPEKSATDRPHYHEYLEYIILLSTDPNDEIGLGGEFVMYIEGEKHCYDRACVIVIPARVWHCPFYFTRVDRPILFYSCSNGPRLVQHMSHSRWPEWNHLEDPPENENLIWDD
jgi:hypothetical protein